MPPSAEPDARHPAVNENKVLQEELAQAREKILSLEGQLEDALVQIEVQRSTIHEGHLRAAEAARVRYVDLEVKYKNDMTELSAKLNQATKDLAGCTAALEAERSRNADLLWRMERVSEDAEACRNLSVSAVKGQVHGFASAVRAYGLSTSHGAFRTWARSVETLKLQRELEDRDMQLRLLKFKGGIDMLSSVFKKWMNASKFAGWRQWISCVMETRQEHALARLLASMTVEQRAQALKRLQYIISAWTGQMQHFAFLDWKKIQQTSKALQHRVDMGARKLIKTRMWRGMRTWADFTRWSRNARHQAEIADLRAQLAIAEGERDRYLRRLDELMEKFLLSRQGAFFDKCDRMLKAWKHGTIFLVWQDWSKWAKASASARRHANHDSGMLDLESRLSKAMAEIASLSKKLAYAEGEANAYGRECGLLKDEIEQWKLKLEASKTEIYKADAAGYARAQAEYEQKLDDLASRLLSKIHGAFADKVNRIMKTWKFGNFALFFSDWKAQVGNRARASGLDKDAQIRGLQKELAHEKSLREQLEDHVKRITGEMDRLRELMRDEQIKARRIAEELEDELIDVKSQLAACVKGRAEDRAAASASARQAEEAHLARIEQLTNQVTAAQSRADKSEREKEDTLTKLHIAKEEARRKEDAEEQEDVQQQEALDNATADLERARTQLNGYKTKVVDANERAERFQAMYDELDAKYQATLEKLEKHKAKRNAAEDRLADEIRKREAYETINNR